MYIDQYATESLINRKRRNNDNQTRAFDPMSMIFGPSLNGNVSKFQLLTRIGGNIIVSEGGSQTMIDRGRKIAVTLGIDGL